ncbi:hypothetical protein [Leucobacter chromiireducens]|uniref:hypothetical protein n=1 Tax=Leucobacter chromiireducens TaxID=283877 RepID=UPI000F62D1F7|nr:hypothetical protein [Leucobacter chromiireducens]
MTLHTKPLAAQPRFRGAIRAEWVQLWSLVSRRVIMGVAFLVIVGSGALLSAALIARLTDERFAGQEISATPMMFVDAVLWAQIAMVILAVLSVTGEYGSGHVRQSLLAFPTRSPWLVGKLGVVGAVGCVVGALGAAASLALSVLILRGSEVQYTFDWAEAASLSARSGLYLALIGILAAAVAMTIRHTVAALSAVLALTLVVPPVLSSIPVVNIAADFLPTIAGRRLISNFDTLAGLSDWQGGAVLGAWVLAAVIAAWTLLKLRDATDN